MIPFIQVLGFVASLEALNHRSGFLATMNLDVFFQDIFQVFQGMWQPQKSSPSPIEVTIQRGSIFRVLKGMMQNDPHMVDASRMVYDRLTPAPGTFSVSHVRCHGVLCQQKTMN